MEFCLFFVWSDSGVKLLLKAESPCFFGKNLAVGFLDKNRPKWEDENRVKSTLEKLIIWDLELKKTPNRPQISFLSLMGDGMKHDMLLILWIFCIFIYLFIFFWEKSCFGFLAGNVLISCQLTLSFFLF